MRLDTADLVDVVVHQLGVVELEISGNKKLSLQKLLENHILCLALEMFGKLYTIFIFCVSPVHGTLPKKLVVVVVLVITSLEERYEENTGVYTLRRYEEG